MQKTRFLSFIFVQHFTQAAYGIQLMSTDEDEHNHNETIKYVCTLLSTPQQQQHPININIYTLKSTHS
jgi:hypothetical protein